MLCLTCEVLGIHEVTEEAVKPIQQIVISGPNQVRFILIDGREVEKDWIDRSRSESWTDEMRRAASDRAKKQHEKRKGGANE